MKAIACFFFLGLTGSFGFAQSSSFTVNDSSGCAPFTVIFTNTSTGVDSVSWDFGDGIISSSLNTNHIYYSTGEYQVILYVFDSLMNVDSSEQTIYVPSTMPFFNLINEACPGSFIAFEVQGNFDTDNMAIWDFGDGFTSNVLNTEHAFNDTGIYNVTLTLVNSACGTVSDSNSISINNNVIPAIHIHPDAADTVICPGSNFPFYYNEGLSILWDFGEGTSTNDPYPIFQYDSIGIYSVTITTTNECGNTNTIDTTIIVDSTLSPQHSIYASITTVCQDDTISFYPISVQTYSFAWNFDNGDSAFGDNVTATFSDTGTYIVSLTAVNACGNTNTATINILVVDSLAALGSIYIANKVVCPTETIQFICTKKNASYMWQFGDGDSALTKSAAHAYTSVGTYPIELTIANFCGQTLILYDTVIVDSSLNSSAEFFLSQSSYCPGGLISFQAASSGFVTHYWNFGDGNTDTITNPRHSYIDTGTFQVTHVVVNSCGNTDTAIATILVDSTGSASANFEVLTGNWVCPGTSIGFNNMSSDTSNSIWYFDDGDSSTQANPAHSYILPGNYLVKLQITNSCGKTSTATRLVTVTNSASLQAPIVTCDNNTLPIIYSWDPVPGALGYLVSEDSGSVWIANNGAGETHSMVATLGTSYTLIVRAIGSNNCPLGLISSPITCTCWDYISEYQFKEQLNVFPNPTSDRLTVKILSQSQVSAKRVLLLFNAQGKLILSNQMAGHSIELDLHELPQGIYLLRVNTLAQSFFRKVILIK